MRTALARLYRPRRFGEMAMQEHVSETLKTAVARGRVAHAYLFCGPRGVGKTTAARVLAMALNCPKREDGEPCGTCESCERIWSGRTSLDVIEIDAASNRGVDDARELRERAMYAPTTEERYKVYIIDEAHMLTREAWNALLKILEEPPPRVIFVFATTEPQKIQQSAPPILSRCQRFDFRRITVPGIVTRLKRVLAEEGIEAGDDALVPIARRAEGGMRDALSLLDQVLSFTDRRLTAEDVRRVLGLVGEELYLELFEILAERRHAEVFRFVERLLDEGYDLAEFYRGLADALRSLLIVKLEGADAADVREDLRATYAERAGRFATGDLLRMLAQVAELDTEGRLRKSASPRILLEALLLRFAYLDRTVELEELIRAAAGGSAVPDAPPPTPAPRAAPDAATRGRGGAEGDEGPAASGRRARVAGRADAAKRAEPPSGPPGVLRSPPREPDAGIERPVEDPQTAAATAALRGVIERGAPGLNRILLAPLREARVTEAGADRVVLEVPAGLDALLSDPATHQALERAFATELGRPLRLEVRREGSTEPPARLTPERVKNDRLARLAREEPLLGRAVEQWDLELLE